LSRGLCELVLFFEAGLLFFSKPLVVNIASMAELPLPQLLYLLEGKATVLTLPEQGDAVELAAKTRLTGRAFVDGLHDIVQNSQAGVSGGKFQLSRGCTYVALEQGLQQQFSPFVYSNVGQQGKAIRSPRRFAGNFACCAARKDFVTAFKAEAAANAVPASSKPGIPPRLAFTRKGILFSFSVQDPPTSSPLSIQMPPGSRSALCVW
jgi:hypothetical protein